MQRDPKLYDELYEFIFKIMIPALVGIAAKVAYTNEERKTKYRKSNNQLYRRYCCLLI